MNIVLCKCNKDKVHKLSVKMHMLIEQIEKDTVYQSREKIWKLRFFLYAGIWVFNMAFILLLPYRYHDTPLEKMECIILGVILSLLFTLLSTYSLNQLRLKQWEDYFFDLDTLRMVGKHLIMEENLFDALQGLLEERMSSEISVISMEHADNNSWLYLKLQFTPYLHPEESHYQYLYLQVPFASMYDEETDTLNLTRLDEIYQHGSTLLAAAAASKNVSL